MAGGLNMVQIIGNVGRDPEIRSFQNGGKVCNLTIATSESWKDKASGEKKEKTEWHKIAIFGPLAGIAEQYVTKGCKLYVCGKLQTRKWQDQQGNDRFSTEIVLQGFDARMEILSKPNQGGGGGGGSSGGSSRGGGDDWGSGGSSGGGGSNGGRTGGSDWGHTGGGGFGDDLDDDIPF